MSSKVLLGLVLSFLLLPSAYADTEVYKKKSHKLFSEDDEIELGRKILTPEMKEALKEELKEAETGAEGPLGELALKLPLSTASPIVTESPEPVSEAYVEAADKKLRLLFARAVAVRENPEQYQAAMLVYQAKKKELLEVLQVSYVSAEIPFVKEPVGPLGPVGGVSKPLIEAPGPVGLKPIPGGGSAEKFPIEKLPLDPPSGRSVPDIEVLSVKLPVPPSPKLPDAPAAPSALFDVGAPPAAPALPAAPAPVAVVAVPPAPAGSLVTSPSSGTASVPDILLSSAPTDPRHGAEMPPLPVTAPVALGGSSPLTPTTPFTPPAALPPPSVVSQMPPVIETPRQVKVNERPKDETVVTVNPPPTKELPKIEQVSDPGILSTVTAFFRDPQKLPTSDPTGVQPVAGSDPRGVQLASIAPATPALPKLSLFSDEKLGTEKRNFFPTAVGANLAPIIVGATKPAPSKFQSTISSAPSLLAEVESASPRTYEAGSGNFTATGSSSLSNFTDVISIKPNVVVKNQPTKTEVKIQAPVVVSTESKAETKAAVVETGGVSIVASIDVPNGSKAVTNELLQRVFARLKNDAAILTSISERPKRKTAPPMTASTFDLPKVVQGLFSGETEDENGEKEVSSWKVALASGLTTIAIVLSLVIFLLAKKRRSKTAVAILLGLFSPHFAQAEVSKASTGTTINGESYSGGDFMEAELTSAREKLNQTFSMIQSGFDTESLCASSRLSQTPEQTRQCREFLVTHAKEFQALTSARGGTPYEISERPLLVETNKTFRPVNAMTALGSKGSIVVHYSAAKASRESLLALLGHELGHKVTWNRDGKAWITDEAPVAGFPSGRAFLDATGAAIASYTLSHASPSQSAPALPRTVEAPVACALAADTISKYLVGLSVDTTGEIPTAAEIKAWRSILESKMAIFSLAQKRMASVESRSAILQSLFRKYLLRGPSDFELDLMLERVNAGIPYELVVASLMGDASYATARQAIAMNQFVAIAYGDLFGRNPSFEETTLLLKSAGKMDRASLVIHMMKRDTGAWSNWISQWYADSLNREPTKEETDRHVRELRSGAGWELVKARLHSGAEYFTLQTARFQFCEKMPTTLTRR